MNQPTRTGEIDAALLEQMPAVARQELYDRARQGGADLEALRALPAAALQQQALAEGIEVPPGTGVPQLVFRLMHHRCARLGLGLGSGVLEVLPDGFGFLRSPASDYQPSADDIYVGPSQVHRLNLRSGHHIAGPVRSPQRGEGYLALLRVESCNGGGIDELRRRLPFDQRVPVLPRQRLSLEHDGVGIEARLVDLLSPWGRGQRVLVQTPPAAGTWWPSRLVAAALESNRDVRAVVCLLDARPEDVTEVRRCIGAPERCEVVGCTFDHPASRQIAIAEMTLQRCQRMVEAGEHVVLALDSLTALVRACQQEQPHSGKVLAAGLEAPALLRSKRLFAAGRNLEGGGSLTVIATVLTGSESRIDQVVAEEFAGKGNAEVVLERGFEALHCDAVLDVLRTGTRREDCLLPAPALLGLRALRAALQGLAPEQRLDHVLQWLRRHPSNDELLRAVAPR